MPAGCRAVAVVTRLCVCLRLLRLARFQCRALPSRARRARTAGAPLARRGRGDRPAPEASADRGGRRPGRNVRAAHAGRFRTGRNLPW
ncbi:hypothetical protein SGM_5723 [Streptomyces griseoaurantiacus M045]|uniref:Uncharacterized protein n=1 Tax=Streptomyces griseoaurantiacus M045 TaxID=996637 RepID=F3NRF9_9ACTN|nr:hypothetical protein SGM_5723 [Streptomyces griseoaurantiacus M045]